MNEQQPWYVHPVVVGAALFCCFPLGLYLVWAKAPWKPTTKAIVTGGVLALLMIGALQKPSNSKAPTTVTRGEAPVAIRRATAPSPARTASPQAPARVEDGSAYAVHEPRLLLPVALENFRISSAEEPSGGGSVSASYDSSSDSDGEVQVYAVTGNEKPPVRHGTPKATKVGSHDAVVVEETQNKRVSISWSSAAWKFELDMNYSPASLHGRAPSRASARKTALKLAPLVATAADHYLDGSPVPPKAERDAHVAEIEKAQADFEANEKAEAEKIAGAAQAKRLQAAVNSYARFLSRAGGGAAVRRVDLDDIDESKIIVTVDDGFLDLSPALQKETARKLWLLWGRFNSPGNPDGSRIRLVTETGDVVAESGMVDPSPDLKE